MAVVCRLVWSIYTSCPHVFWLRNLRYLWATQVRIKSDNRALSLFERRSNIGSMRNLNSNTLTSGLLLVYIPVPCSSVHKLLHNFCPVYLLYSDSVSIAQIEAMPLYLSMDI
jgi:hypothetical protein